MAFEVCFRNDVETKFIGEIVEVRMVGLMSSTNGIDVTLLHSDHIGPHGFIRHCSARVGIVLVSVHAVDDDRFSIDQHVGTTELDTVEAHLLADILLAGPEHNRVQSRSLRGP